MASTEVIKLLPHQVPHVESITNILSSNYWAIDSSVMGSGKTVTSLMTANIFGFPHIIVICPASVINSWKTTSEKYGMEVEIISYESLRSVKNCQPKHGFLKRIDTVTDFINKVSFKSTSAFKDYCDEGCIVIVDEFQRLKNKSDQNKAVKALSKTIQSSEYSKLLLLSGTPYDKKVHVINVLQMVGVIKSSRLYIHRMEDNYFRLHGAQELIDVSMIMDKHETDNFMKSNIFDQTNTEDLCYDLYLKVIHPKITSAMIPQGGFAKAIAYNKYCKMDKHDSKILEKSIRQLTSSLINPDETRRARKTNDWGAITKALQNIEISKVNVFARLAIEALIENPQSKVVIALNYHDSIDMVSELLRDYEPLIFTGKEGKKRFEISDAFQLETNKNRVLIGTRKVLAVGINLDDRNGKYPRKMFCSPDYDAPGAQQLAARVGRVTSKSQSLVYFIYGECGHKENSILNSLARKTEVMKNTLKEQKDNGVIFPSDYVILKE